MVKNALTGAQNCVHAHENRMPPKRTWECDDEGYAMNPHTGKRFAYGDVWERRLFFKWNRFGTFVPMFLSAEAFEHRNSSKKMYRTGSTRTLAFVTNNLYQGARARARKRGVPFQLTKEWIRHHLETAWNRGEVVLATKGTGERSPRAASIDRIVPHVGYVEENCRIVPVQINCAKGEWDEESFLAVVGAEVDRLRAARQDAMIV